MSRHTHIIQVRPAATPAQPDWARHAGVDWGFAGGHTRVVFMQRGPFDDQPVREAAVTFREPTVNERRHYCQKWSPYFTRVYLVNRTFEELCVSSWGEPLDPLDRFHFRERALNMLIDALNNFSWED